MSNDLKQRKKAPPSKPTEGAKAEQERGAAKAGKETSSPASLKSRESRSVCPEPRTALCLLSLCVCLASSWFVFQQSVVYADVEKRFRLLEIKASELEALGDKIGLLSAKCEESQNIMDHQKKLLIPENIEYMQQDILTIKGLAKTLTDKREQLQKNMTTLSQKVIKMEQSSASVTTEVSGKITVVKTDIRRISGLGSDVNTLTDSVQELESKLEKVVKKTEQHIGNLLASNIERITELRSSVTRNSERIDIIKKKFSELLDDFKKHSGTLLNIQGDRVRVLKTLTFVKDLKPKVHNMKNDFALLNPVVHDLTLRIGRLASDLLQREEEIATLNEKLSHLSQVTTNVNDMKDKVIHLSENNS
ncbi:inhibitor of nuclear factor kappa-B kinase-interacting protein isoform X2 [Lissotriton helveticus]